MSEWFLSWIGILCIVSSFFLVSALLSSTVTLEDVMVFSKTLITHALPRFVSGVFRAIRSLLSKIYRKLIHLNTLAKRFRALMKKTRALPLSRLGPGSPPLPHRLSLSKSSSSSSSPSSVCPMSSSSLVSTKEMRRSSKRSSLTLLQHHHRSSIPSSTFTTTSFSSSSSSSSSSSLSSLESCKSGTDLAQDAEAAAVADEPPSLPKCTLSESHFSQDANEGELYFPQQASLLASHLTRERSPFNAPAVESPDKDAAHGPIVNNHSLGPMSRHPQSLKERRKSWEVVEPHLSLYQLPYMHYVRQTKSMFLPDSAAMPTSPSNSEASDPVMMPEPVVEARPALESEPEPEPVPEPEPESRPLPESKREPEPEPESQSPPMRSLSTPPCPEPMLVASSSSSEPPKPRLSVSHSSSAAVARRRSSGHKERWYSPFVSGLDIELHFVQRPSSHLSGSSLHQNTSSGYDCLGPMQSVNQTFIPATLPKFSPSSAALAASTSSILSEGWLRRTSASHHHRSHHSHSHSHTHTHSHHPSHRSHQSHRAGPTAADLNRHFSLFEKSLFMPIS